MFPTRTCTKDHLLRIMLLHILNKLRIKLYVTRKRSLNGAMYVSIMYVCFSRPVVKNLISPKKKYSCASKKLYNNQSLSCRAFELRETQGDIGRNGIHIFWCKRELVLVVEGAPSRSLIDLNIYDSILFL